MAQPDRRPLRPTRARSAAPEIRNSSQLPGVPVLPPYICRCRNLPPLQATGTHATRRSAGIHKCRVRATTSGAQLRGCALRRPPVLLQVRCQPPCDCKNEYRKCVAAPQGTKGHNANERAFYAHTVFAHPAKHEHDVRCTYACCQRPNVSRHPVAVTIPRPPCEL
jgi:hypothetical protein